MKRPVSGIIKSYYPSLTNSEQKVATFVLNNLDKVIYYSVTDLAYEAEVGETTVLRFCRKIGLKGYQEFKLKIAQSLSTDTQEDTMKSDNLVGSILKNAVETMTNTASMIDESNLNKAINLLDGANSINFFGMGSSGITARDAKNRLLRIGRRVGAIIDPHMQAMTAATLGENDVVVGISNSGSTRDTIETLEIAKENGASIIALTYYARSPITQFADIVLIGGSQESPLEGGSLTSKISQLFIVDLLCTGIALLKKEDSLEMKNKTAKSVISKIY